MITICIILLLAILIAALVLFLGGVLYVIWPVAVILVAGLLIDIFVIRSMFRKKNRRKKTHIRFPIGGQTSQ